MISVKKKFLFIHVPKTGGTSIQTFLKDYSADEVTINTNHDRLDGIKVLNNKYNTNKHSTITQYKKAIEPEVYQQLFKFAIIRNPWDLMISRYFSAHKKWQAWDKQSFKQLITQVVPLRNYVSLLLVTQKINRKLGINLFPHFKPIDQDIDFLIRFEHLNDDFKKVCDILDISFTFLPHRNKSNRQPYSHYYDKELIELVRNKFKEEIALGKYVFE